jgi:hypothetical protein
VEDLGLTDAVEHQQRVDHEMSKIQDGAVDIEDDAQLMVGKVAADRFVVIREGSHPICALWVKGEDHTDKVATRR